MLIPLCLKINHYASYLEPNSRSMHKPAGGLSDGASLQNYKVSIYKGAIVFSEHNSRNLFSVQTI
jgi:hypothetical protein